MFLFRLALKNLLRSKRRTLLASAAVVVGIFYLVVGQAFIGGFEESIIRGATDATLGHIALQPKDYPDEPLTFPLDDLLEPDPATLAWLEQQEAWTARLNFQVTVVHGAESMRAQGIAYDPGRDSAVFSRATWSSDGEEPTTASDGILIGHMLAGNLEVAKGDEVVLQVRTAAGAINAMPVTIAGVLSSGNPMLDAMAIFVTRDLAQELVRTDRSNQISVLLADRDDVGEAQAALEPIVAGAGMEVLTWVEETKDLLAMQQVRRTMLNVLVGMLLLMSSMAIANTILMAAHERVREIGTLRAMGMSRSGVLGLFLAEGSMMGAVAGLAGAIPGAAIAWRYSVTPIDFGKLMESSAQAGASLSFSSFVYTEFSAPIVVIPLVISFFVALVASIYPAITASAMEPADAVRAA